MDSVTDEGADGGNTSSPRIFVLEPPLVTNEDKVGFLLRQCSVADSGVGMSAGCTADRFVR